MLRRTRKSELNETTTDSETDRGNDENSRKRRLSNKIILFCACVVILGAMFICKTSPAPTTEKNLQQKPPKRFSSTPTDSKSRRIPRKNRLFTPPPYSHKLFCAVSRWPVSEAFKLRGFRRIGNCKNAAFFNLCMPAIEALNEKDLRPWNRPNWLPGTDWISDKDLFLQRMKQYHKEIGSGHGFSFFPEAYELDDASDRIAFLERLEKKGGMDKAWVFKDLENEGQARGVTFIGPQSQQLKSWKERLVIKQDGEIDHKSHHIVQKYVENLLTYHGHKFHIRSFFIIASANPPLVYYHDGYLHVAPNAFNQTDFGNDADDPRNVHASSNSWKKKAEISEEELKISFASFDEFGKFLRSYISDEAPQLRHLQHPLSHIRNQMKEAGAQVFTAFRDHCFDMSDFPVENAYEIIGADFFVDKDLQIWMIELNTGAGLYTDSPVKRKVVKKLLPEMVDALSEIYKKQLNGDAIWPLKSVTISDPIYSDDVQYSYDDKPTNTVSN